MWSLCVLGLLVPFLEAAPTKGSLPTPRGQFALPPTSPAIEQLPDLQHARGFLHLRRARTATQDKATLLVEAARLRGEVATLTATARAVVTSMREQQVRVKELTDEANGMGHDIAQLMKAKMEVTKRRIRLERNVSAQNETVIELRAEIPKVIAKAQELAAKEGRRFNVTYYKLEPNTVCPNTSMIVTKTECNKALQEFYTGTQAAVGWEGEESASPGGCSFRVADPETDSMGILNKDLSGVARDSVVPICKNMTVADSDEELEEWSRNVTKVENAFNTLLPGGEVSNEMESLNAEYKAYREAVAAVVETAWADNNSYAFESFKEAQRRNLANLSEIVSGTFKDPCDLAAKPYAEGAPGIARAWVAAVREIRGCV